MAQIISFVKKQKTTEEANRWKAIAKGQVRHFTCDDCGADIEVINEDYPDLCPGCGRFISGWKKSEENI